MAKLTLDGLKTFVKNYVTAAKQAGAWSASTNNLYSLQDKIGKQITLDGGFNDKLPEMDGTSLPLGKTIEEYMLDLVAPATYTDAATDGANTLAPNMPVAEAPSYSYTLGRRYFKTTEPYDNIERAALTEGDAANMLAKITQRLYNSYDLYKYQQKKQILANLIAKAEAATNSATLVQTIAIPTNTTTSEAFIKQVKEDVETASFANEGHNLGNCLIGAAPSLTLYIKKGVLPTVEVDALAGAFNQERLAIPATIKVVDDFADNNTGVYAMLVDSRGLKLHRGYQAIRTQENAQGDYINFVMHSENTAFISKFTFVKIYKG